MTDSHAVRWAAPEVLDRERPITKASDIYSFAMVVIEVRARTPPRLNVPLTNRRYTPGVPRFVTARPLRLSLTFYPGVDPVGRPTRI